MTDQPILRPTRAGLVDTYSSWLDRDELRVQRCLDCGTTRHVPRHLCPSCRGDRYDWIRCSGDGELYSWTTTVRPLHPAFQDVPFTVGVVTLAEGVRVTAPILEDADLRVGLPVRLVIQHPADGLSLPAFTPATGREPESQEVRP